MDAVNEDYDSLEKCYRRCGLEVPPAEVHGLLCGLLCAHSPDAEGLWARELFDEAGEGDLLQRECRESVAGLFARTREAITGPGLGFTPLLPPDEAPLQRRAAAMKSWVDGFLYGLGLGGRGMETLQGDVREVLEDLARIARLDEESGESEENEEAYTELVEYLWVAAMLVYSEGEGQR